MSFAALDAFYESYKATSAEAELEAICEDLQGSAVVDEVKGPDEKKMKQAELEPPPVETPTPPSPVVAPRTDALVAHGVLTEGGKVPIIDDEHPVRLAIQTLPPEKLVKGRRVRYSYVEKNDVRKDIVVLEVLSDPFSPHTSPAAGSAAVPEPIPPPAAVPIATSVASIAMPDPNTTRQMVGHVVAVRKVNEVTALQVKFDDGAEEVIQLTAEICEKDYDPVAQDLVVVHCEDNDEDDEELEQKVTITKILPAQVKAGTGTITELCEAEGYGVLDGDTIFAKIHDGYAVGVSLEYNCVACRRDGFKWRCLSTQLVDEGHRQRIDTSSLELVNDETNFQDRNGLSIVNRHELSFRIYQLDKQADLNIVFANTSDKAYRLLNLYSYCPTRKPVIHTRGFKPMLLNAHSTVDVRIYAKPRFLCNHEEFAIALFSHEMCLVAPVKIAVGSDAMVPRLKMVEMQYKASQLRAVPVTERPRADEHFKVKRAARKFVHTRINNYFIPEKVWEFMCLDEREFTQKCAEEFPELLEDLDGMNYKQRLHGLEYIAEAHLKKCFRVYEFPNMRFEMEGALFVLRLENLAESRPSVLLEDTVQARESGVGGGGTMYSGIIKAIKNDRVLFEFPDQFVQGHLEKRFDVAFRYNRGPFKKRHHALDEICKAERWGEDFLFPCTVDEKPPLMDVSFDCAEHETAPERLGAPMRLREAGGVVRDVPWQNAELNWYQKTAIVNALRAECRPLPHLICGPPGTGKTSTLVELVLQQYMNSRSSHMLVCTPSNSAANLILEKLIRAEQLVKDAFIRIIGFQARERDLIPEHLLPYCGTTEKGKDETEGLQMTFLDNGFRENCQRDYLCDFRIIVVTIGSVGTFMEMGFPEDHFTHLFVDEAGQCLETEIIIPLSLLSKASGHMVFVGDEKQLGPVVQFKPLVDWGYGRSLFERLQGIGIYNRADPELYDRRLCIQLVNNYRSVPNLLSLYNTMFYGGTLRPMIVNESEAEFECLRSVSQIFKPTAYRTKNAAVYFKSIKGPCRRTTLNPSWFNPDEVTAVHHFYKELLNECGVSAMDVGIISPYQEQVRVIRSYLENDGLELPKIGSVEEFQGQERMIILISTVRSKRRTEDQQFGLGFVNNPKRINVALSRARALLVIFGNPLVISEDPNWKRVVMNCQKQMCYEELAPIKR